MWGSKLTFNANYNNIKDLGGNVVLIRQQIEQLKFFKMWEY